MDKKEFSPARPSAYSPGLSRIFFRKDLTVEPPQHQPPPMTTNSDLNFSSLLTKLNVHLPEIHHMSPSQASIEDEASLDDGDNADLTEALSAARDKQLIALALDTMARVQCLDSPSHEAPIPRMPAVDDNGPLLHDYHMRFQVQIPGPVPAYLNAHYVCESGSRLLFTSVHWAASIPAFQSLSVEIQVSLIRNCWSDLFALGLAQTSRSLPLSMILAALVAHLHGSIAQDRLPATRVKLLAEHLVRLQDFVASMQRLHVDDNEYAYLKALVVFSADAVEGRLERLQERAVQGLRAHLSRKCDDGERFSKLLLRLPPLRAFEAQVIEELFFSAQLGPVQIESVVPYILRMSPTGAHSARQVKTEQQVEFN